jgi:hypothetical protein
VVSVDLHALFATVAWQDSQRDTGTSFSRTVATISRWMKMTVWRRLAAQALGFERSCTLLVMCCNAYYALIALMINLWEVAPCLI